MEDFLKEDLFLQNVIKEIENKKKDLKAEEEFLKNNISRNYDLYEAILYENKREQLKIQKNEDSPYFAKIEFKNEKDAKKETVYIGKGSFKNHDNYLIVDWRAPISSLYYDSSLGKTTYSSPGGVQSGELSLKRQIVIDNKKLKSFQDIDVMAQDELLKPYLKARTEVKLKNIIATIQKEQNEIIRQDLFKNMIIQGVAGSGKTTVALHKIAFLIYNHAQKQSDFLIIGPNKLFLKYIGGLLPDLEAEQALQFTFEEFCFSYLEKDYIVKNSSILNYETNKNNNFLRYKSSLGFKNDLEGFLNSWGKSLIDGAIEFKGVTLISNQELLHVFDSIPEKNIRKKFNLMIDYYADILKNETILREMIDKSCEKLYEFVDGKEIFNLKIEMASAFEKKGRQFLKSKLNLDKYNLDKVYKKFLNYFKSNLPKNAHLSEKHVQETVQNLELGVIDFEDIPALTFIQNRVFSLKNLDNICHTVVDEAQDLGEFAYFVLKNVCKKSAFSVYGDLNQAISNTTGVKDWAEVESVFDEVLYKELTKTYRTTETIMQLANSLARFAPIIKGEPVIRMGEKVKLHIYEDDFSSVIKNIVLKEKERGFATIGIICRSKQDCKKVFDALQNEGIEALIADTKTSEKLSKINILTVFDSKGLEFDSVIIVDVNEQNYNHENSLEVKMLYVAITRAVHNLNIISSKNISKLIENIKDKITY